VRGQPASDRLRVGRRIALGQCPGADRCRPALAGAWARRLRGQNVRLAASWGGASVDCGNAVATISADSRGRATTARVCSQAWSMARRVFRVNHLRALCGSSTGISRVHFDPGWSPGVERYWCGWPAAATRRPGLADTAGPLGDRGQKSLVSSKPASGVCRPGAPPRLAAIIHVVTITGG